MDQPLARLADPGFTKRVARGIRAGPLGLILSKALLLAADRKLTDPTITRQIGGAPSA